VIAGVLTVAGTDIRVGVDPDDRKVVSVPVSERGERRDAHRALSTEGRDPGRVVLADDLKGTGKLLDDHRLSFHAVTFCQTLIGHGDRGSHGRAVVRR
jgi:hypothetical protein